MSLDKADIAILISCFSAIAGVSSAIFTGIMARNDSKKMRRRSPALELSISNTDSTDILGWRSCVATVRNLEDVGLVITGFEATGRRAFVNSLDDATDGEDGFGGPTFRSTLVSKKSTALRLKANPKGSAAPVATHGDTIHVKLFTKGVSKSSDLKLLWEWADGQK